MIERLIRACVAKPFLTVFTALAVAAFGGWTMPRLALDALPDVSDAQVVITSEWPGRSPDLIENQITYPIVSSLLSVPRVTAVRGFTELGISYVYVVFEDGTDLYWARSRVLEYLQGIRGRVPDGVNPTIGPDATGADWIFQYALVDETGTTTLDGLRSLQDWTVRYALASVPGVADVASIGGFVRQYQVALDPERLNALNVSPMEVVDAIRAGNDEAEGRVLERTARQYIVRSRGFLGSPEQIAQIALRADASGTPVRVSDVADVRVGPDMRGGAAELDGRGEAVGGIVVMRKSGDALDVIERVKARLREVEQTLPAGVKLVTVYDRSGLIRDAIATLRTSLLEQLVVVSLVIVAFLSHWRPAAVPLMALPLAIAFSFVPLWYFQVPVNIMSLGGIAMAIGVLMDASIVMVENGYRRVMESEATSRADQQATLLAGACQVGRPVFLSLLLIVISFLPVFLLEGEEGRLFRPLAVTKTLTMTAASLLAVTVVPVVMLALIRRGASARREVNLLTSWCARLYEPVLRWALNHRIGTLAVNAAVIPLAVPLLMTLGREFMPPLYEGALLYMPTLRAGLPTTDATRLLQVQDRVLRQFPEVDRVFGTIGRSTTATDNSAYGMVNTTLTLKPRKEWRPGVTFEGLQREMNEALQIPGVRNVWTQPIRGRLDMLATGIKTPVGVKVLGNDVTDVEEVGQQVAAVLASLPGTRNVYAERFSEAYYADITPDREALGRYGLSVRDLQQIVRIAIGGASIGELVAGRERYPISVRYNRDFRGDVSELERVLVKTPAGGQVALRDLGAVTLNTGPAMIRDENGLLATYVYVDTDGRDIGGYVDRAMHAVSDALALPVGTRLEWTGQYQQQLRAAARLQLLVPLVLVAILMVLYLIFHSVAEALVVVLSVAYGMTGGVLLQWWLGQPFSVAVWVGYIALFGVAVQTGVVMIVYLREAVEVRRRSSRHFTAADLFESIVAGAVLRLRPKLMTVATTVLGLLPILWGTGVGTDLLRPMAVPIVGGMVTSAIHVLLITPVIFFMMQRRQGVALPNQSDSRDFEQA